MAGAAVSAGAGAVFAGATTLEGTTMTFVGVVVPVFAGVALAGAAVLAGAGVVVVVVVVFAGTVVVVVVFAGVVAVLLAGRLSHPARRVAHTSRAGAAKASLKDMVSSSALLMITRP